MVTTTEAGAAASDNIVAPPPPPIDKPTPVPITKPAEAQSLGFTRVSGESDVAYLSRVNRVIGAEQPISPATQVSVDLGATPSNQIDEKKITESQKGLPTKPSELSPEKKAEYDAVVAEEEKALAPIKASIESQKQVLAQAQEDLSKLPPDVLGEPQSQESIDASNAVIEAQNTLQSLQNQYDSLGQFYQAKRLTIAGYVFSFTGATPEVIGKSYEQTTALAAGGKTAFDYAKANKLIPDDAIFVPGQGTKWSYSTKNQLQNQINNLVTQNVLDSNALKDIGTIGADTPAKLEKYISQYNTQQLQNTINTLVTANVLGRDELASIGGSDASKIADQQQAREKINQFVSSYNASQTQNTINALVSAGVLDSEKVKSLSGLSQEEQRTKLQSYINEANAAVVSGESTLNDNQSIIAGNVAKLQSIPNVGDVLSSVYAKAAATEKGSPEWKAWDDTWANYQQASAQNAINSIPNLSPTDREYLTDLSKSNPEGFSQAVGNIMAGISFRNIEDAKTQINALNVSQETKDYLIKVAINNPTSLQAVLSYGVGKPIEFIGGVDLVGQQKLDELKADPTRNIPQDAVLDKYDSVTGQISYHSPSQQVVEITVGDNKITVPKSEWESMSPVAQFETILGRTSSRAEFQDYYTKDISRPSPFQPGAAEKDFTYYVKQNEARQLWEKAHPDISPTMSALSSLGEHSGLPSVKAAFYPQIKVKDLTFEENVQTGVTAAAGIATVLGLGELGAVGRVVSGLGGAGATYLTVKNWNELTPAEKALAVVSDAGFFAGAFMPSKIGTSAADKQIMSNYKDMVQTAKEANAAMSKVKEGIIELPKTEVSLEAVSKAKSAYNKFVESVIANPESPMAQKFSSKIVVDAAKLEREAYDNMVKAMGKRPEMVSWKPEDVRLAGEAQKAIQEYKIAHDNFVGKLDILNQLDPNKLAQIEKESGITGLSKSIKDISDNNASINRAWNELDKARSTGDATLVSQKLNDLQEAKSNFNASLEKFNNVIQSRTPSGAILEPYAQEWNRVIQEAEDSLRKSGELGGSFGSTGGAIQRQYAMDTLENLRRLRQAGEPPPMELRLKQPSSVYETGIKGSGGIDWENTYRLTENRIAKLESGGGELPKKVEPPPIDVLISASQESARQEPAWQSWLQELRGEKPKEPMPGLTPEQQTRYNEVLRLSRESRRKYEEGVLADKLAVQRLQATMEQPKLSFEPEVAKIPEPLKAKAKVLEVVPEATPSTQPKLEIVPSTETKTEPVISTKEAPELSIGTKPAKGISPDVVSKSVSQAMASFTTEFTPDVQSRLLDITKIATDNAYNLITSGATLEQVNIQTSQFIDNQIKAQFNIDQQQQIEPFTQTLTDTAIQTATQSVVKPDVITAPTTRTEAITEVTPEALVRAGAAADTAVAVSPDIFRIDTGGKKDVIKERAVKPPPFIPTPKKKTQLADEKKIARIKEGSVVWVQGSPKGGRMYRVIVPPYGQEDSFSMRTLPPGYNDEGWTGEGSAKASLQIIGGLPEKDIENIDLGWTRINIRVASGKPEIEYVHDADANVGARDKTVGQGKGQIPIQAWEEAKSRGVSYEDFVNSYSGELVDGKPEPQTPTPETTPVKVTTPEQSNDKQTYEELVALAESYGLKVEEVPYSQLKDYAAMNPDFAQTIGYEIPADTIQLNSEYNKTFKDKADNLWHELDEMGKIEQGSKYWDAHTDALHGEKKPSVQTVTMPQPRPESPVHENIEPPTQQAVEKTQPEETLPPDVTVVQSYVRHKKPEKNWWETKKPIDNRLNVARRYRNRSILPPQVNI